MIRRESKMRKGITLGMLLISLCLFAMMLEKPFAQEAFPTKPITVLVGFPPGGPADITARSYAPAASKLLGQPVIVLNKPGAGGTVAIDTLAGSKPDGYTLVEAGLSTLAYGMHTQGVSWGPKDFTIILGHTLYNFAVVIRSDAPWKSFDEWVQYVRENPGFKYGTYGALSTMHIMMEWIAKRLNLKMVPVHFPGDAPGMTSLLGGHIQAQLVAGTHASLIKAGKLRTLLQVTSEPVDADAKSVARLKNVLPDAPMELVKFPRGIFGPKGMPVAIQEKLNETFMKASVENPEFIKTHQLMNMAVEYHGPKELQEGLQELYEDFGKILKNLGLERK
jgi:tripartite-type tricarboxylate transporter receptor subunit TctC